MGARGFQSGARALTDEAALEFGERAEYLKHEPAARRRRVDRLGERPESDLAALQLFDRLDELLQRPREPVEFPDDECVAGAKIVERGDELRPIALRARAASSKTRSHPAW